MLGRLAQTHDSRQSSKSKVFTLVHGEAVKEASKQSNKEKAKRIVRETMQGSVSQNNKQQDNAGWLDTRVGTGKERAIKPRAIYTGA